MTPARQVRVLLVEDNPLVLGLLQKGLEPLCDVRTAADGADALMKIVDDPPDLIISDYKMPGLDGRQLYEKLRSREQTKSLPFIFLASRGDVEERLRPQVEGVEDFIIKPFFVKDLVRRAKKVVDRVQLEKLQQRSARPGVIQGRLEEMNMMDLLQSLEIGQKSCKLTITHGSETCDMFFIAGACRHAKLGSIEGNEAVFKAVAWTDGEFEIDFSGTTDRITTTMTTQGLLMEAFRLMDEAQRDAMDAANPA